MKKILLTALAVTFLLSVKAQSSIATKKDTDKVFTVIEISPEFPGGMDKFHQYLSSNIHYPEQAWANKEQGRVLISMIVEEDGSLLDIKVIKSVSPFLDEEAIRVMSASPKWKPGVRNGHKVKMRYVVPINFSLDNK